jgi:invasion protein IalB
VNALFAGGTATTRVAPFSVAPFQLRIAAHGSRRPSPGERHPWPNAVTIETHCAFAWRGLGAMRAAASYVFCVLVLAALSVVPAQGEEPHSRPTAVNSVWTKFCLNDVCYVGRGRRRSDCALIGEVTLVERTAETGRRLSIAMAARINPERAIRITIDGNKPVNHEISRCDCACWIDTKAGPELVEALKRGRSLVLEAVGRDHKPHIVIMPLAGFAETYDGPASLQTSRGANSIASQPAVIAETTRKRSCPPTSARNIF